MAARFFTAMAVLAVVGTVARAEDFHQIVRKSSNGNMTITNVINLPCPVVETKIEEKPPFKDAVPVTLQVESWNGASVFTDGLGRKWRLLDGRPLGAQYTHIPGWMVTKADQSEYFYSHGGRIFGRDGGATSLSPFSMLAPLLSQPMPGRLTGGGASGYAGGRTGLYAPYIQRQTRSGLYTPYLKK